MTGRLGSAAGILLGLLLIAGAWGVAQLAPEPETLEAPVPVRVEAGDWGIGRDIAGAAGEEVVVAQRLTDDGREPWNGASEAGLWIAVRAEVQTLRRTGTAAATLEYAGLLVPASDRPPTAVRLPGTLLRPGIAAGGWFVFEVPAGIPMPDAVTLRFGRGGDVRLDSVLVTRIDLAAAPRLAELVLDPVVERARP